jgi:hypothetical protein
MSTCCQVPLLLLGGGGYTMRNVARCWCYETGRMLGDDLEDKCALMHTVLADESHCMPLSSSKRTVAQTDLGAVAHVQSLSLVCTSASLLQRLSQVVIF